MLRRDATIDAYASDNWVNRTRQVADEGFTPSYVCLSRDVALFTANYALATAAISVEPRCGVEIVFYDRPAFPVDTPIYVPGL